MDNITPRRPGSTVTIGYLRNSAKMTAVCTVDNRTTTESAANREGSGNTPEIPEVNLGKAKLGLTVSDLPGNAPSRFHGVLVRSVLPGSFADELDPQVGPGSNYRKH